MSYKTILVHVDETEQLATRVEVAARLALRAAAHLIGVAATGNPRPLHAAPAAGPAAGAAAPASGSAPAILLQRQQAALAGFETLARTAGATSCEQQLIDDDAAVAVSRQGQYADLVVLGQGEPGAGAATGSVDFPEYVVLNSACPVLIVPRAGCPATLCERVLVAWDGSRAAGRAVRDALPLLETARKVRIAEIDTPAGIGHNGATASGLVAFLGRHAVNAEPVRRTAQDDAGHGLLSLAADLDCDLLVMGCVAHMHTRRMALGGATDIVLASATLPVLMSH